MPDRNGVYTRTSKIADVVARYNVKEPWQKREDDIVLELTLDIGKSFQPSMRVGGFFNRNDDGSIKNNGTATKVKILIESAGLNWDKSIDENNQLTDQALEELQNSEICTLSYVYGTTKTGKTGWSYWNEVAKPGEDDTLKNKFFIAVDKGWVRDYNPEDTGGFDPSELEESKSKSYQL